MRYTCVGPVRGCCDRAHRSEETAQACLDADSKACKAVGGFSDRRMVKGQKYTYSERCVIPDRVVALLGPRETNAAQANREQHRAWTINQKAWLSFVQGA